MAQANRDGRVALAGGDTVYDQTAAEASAREAFDTACQQLTEARRSGLAAAHLAFTLGQGIDYLASSTTIATAKSAFVGSMADSLLATETAVADRNKQYDQLEAATFQTELVQIGRKKGTQPILFGTACAAGHEKEALASW